MTQDLITQDGEVIESMGITSSVAVQLQKAEIDQLITTARAYPRSMSRVQGAIMNMATLDEESAEECMYALPRGGKPIKGPSIRFAEILKQAFGNCRAGARVVDVNRVEMFIEAEGVFHDLETNSSTTARVRRRISDKNGKLFKDDMIIVTGNAACSIAMRNAILAGVPKPLWRKAYDAVQATITGDITTLSENRGKALKALAAFGVKPEQIFTSLGRDGLDDISVDDIATLRGMYSALKNGEATVEEMFFGTVRAASTHEKLADPLSDAPIEKKADAPAETDQVEFEQESGSAPSGPDTGTDTSPGQAPAEAEVTAPTTSASPSIPEEMRVHFIEFAKKAFRNAVDKDLTAEKRIEFIKDMEANYRDAVPEDLWKKLATISVSAQTVAHNPKEAGKRREFVAKDLLECSPSEIGG
ncbi:hypothetical protein LAV84_18535 [Rhizobium sp. VS19-DR104.2]|uniref:hypothetical protein n=1 Tax=unclassified Rhizobium TaxID=2613769 RepID=UPI001CC5429A|nr:MULTISPECIES: hypothetical protein [unclassified Rhizobium]MBZ5761535.1 hypothetical protein [Rhizobium sp. VS19-DR96]MBZ5767483.1 hypothetical protein [Rhizobium sp. VS19-DR129.2]MBZ5775068.1 hypothetical protein [Rhizobium sp. VS19-DRK62.2]MBZ5785967.1 hypothetical protein [Rhizobium sp. VS19-DR121]MBZ5803393.1 hypothetical protein [Rhizobium sp. VS19-DR181]